MLPEEAHSGFVLVRYVCKVRDNQCGDGFTTRSGGHLISVVDLGADHRMHTSRKANDARETSQHPHKLRLSTVVLLYTRTYVCVLAICHQAMLLLTRQSPYMCA